MACGEEVNTCVGSLRWLLPVLLPGAGRPRAEDSARPASSGRHSQAELVISHLCICTCGTDTHKGSWGQRPRARCSPVGRECDHRQKCQGCASAPGRKSPAGNHLPPRVFQTGRWAAVGHGPPWCPSGTGQSASPASTLDPAPFPAAAFPDARPGPGACLPWQVTFQIGDPDCSRTGRRRCHEKLYRKDSGSNIQVDWQERLLLKLTWK